MLKLYLILPLIALCCSLDAYAQQRNELKGPQAKNYKIGKQTRPSETRIVLTHTPRPTGPAAKQTSRPLVFQPETSDSVQVKIITIGRNPYEGLLGPQLKNRQRSAPEVPMELWWMDKL